MIIDVLYKQVITGENKFAWMWVTFHRSESLTNQLLITFHPFYILRNHLTRMVYAQREAVDAGDVQREAEGGGVFQVPARGDELQVKGNVELANKILEKDAF